MKKTMSFLLIFSISLIGYSQSKPHLSFEKTTHDFGTFKEEKGIQTYQFKFINTGKLPLIITNIKPSCGCTTPKWSKAPVASGKEGFISVEFDPNNRPGPFDKSITISSNSDEPSKILQIKGKVIEKVKTTNDFYPDKMGTLRLKTKHIAMTKVAKNASKTNQIVFFNPTKKPIKVAFDAIPKHIGIKQKKVIIPAETEIKVNITYHAKLKKDWGFVSDVIFLIIDGKRDSNNRIRISADLFEDFSKRSVQEKANAPSLEINKRLLDLGTIKKGKIIKHQFIITNTGKSDLLIRKVNSSCDCTVPKIASKLIKPGASVNLDVSFDSKGLSGPQIKTITIITNDPIKPKTVIRIKGNIETK